ANEQITVGDEVNIPDLGDPETSNMTEEEVDKLVEQLTDFPSAPSDAQRPTPSQQLRKEISAPNARVKKIWLWRPLTFPPVPEKGEFDVSRIEKSQYFFS
ncbi:MAG: hypothetical protein Q9192_008832, partial [Flavoplaca navasiana]